MLADSALGRLGARTRGREGQFYTCAHKHTRANLMVVAFRGTDDLRDGLIDDLTGIGFAATLALHTSEVLDFAQRMQKSCKDLWLVGHSLGGAYVQFVGAKLGIPASRSTRRACST